MEKNARRVISPGKLDCELISRITAKDESERMPPKKANKPLSAKEIDTLRGWIAEGAKWSVHWAYVPPIKHPIPDLKGDWPANWIDRFILERLQREKLARRLMRIRLHWCAASIST